MEGGKVDVISTPELYKADDSKRKFNELQQSRFLPTASPVVDARD
jgi:hypothetical protein